MWAGKLYRQVQVLVFIGALQSLTVSMCGSDSQNSIFEGECVHGGDALRLHKTLTREAHFGTNLPPECTGSLPGATASASNRAEALDGAGMATNAEATELRHYSAAPSQCRDDSDTIFAPHGMSESIRKERWKKASGAVIQVSLSEEDAADSGVSFAKGETVVLSGPASPLPVLDQPHFTDELQELAVVESRAQPPGSSYLSDLNALISGNSDWLFCRPKADASTENGDCSTEKEDSLDSDLSYLDELGALIAPGESKKKAGIVARYRTATVRQQPERPVPSVPGSATGVAPYTSISPDARCENPGDLTLNSYFQPVSSITIAGLSTDPPRRHEESGELRRPVDNEACVYMSAFPRNYYVTARAQVSGHPARNTLCLEHNPLYFEDPDLERCGRSKGCLTSAWSSVHFVSTIAMSPLLVARQCPNSCVTALPDCPSCTSFGPDAYFGGLLPFTR